jgi:hypothetical protein
VYLRRRGARRRSSIRRSRAAPARRNEETLLYQLIEQHCPALLTAREAISKPRLIPSASWGLRAHVEGTYSGNQVDDRIPSVQCVRETEFKAHHP